jgi:hypothetical protein
MCPLTGLLARGVDPDGSHHVLAQAIQAMPEGD